LSDIVGYKASIYEGVPFCVLQAFRICLSLLSFDYFWRALLSMLPRFLLFLFFISFNAALLPVSSSELKELFRDKLENACLKIDRKIICSCYARAVVSRYNDQQLAAISRLLKDKEANQMFLIVHGPEGGDCKSQFETS
tara:strand:+ start:283 stop:699 length:417 start_codon:yes stop_codon:yes gene_type:complete